MPAPAIEQHVWAMVERFIRDPGHVLTLLAERRQGEASAIEEQRGQLARVMQDLEEIQQARDRILALYRRGRISERDLDRQLDAIGQEEAKQVRKQERLLADVQRVADRTDRLETARTLLQHLHARLDSEPITPALQRELVCKLVDNIRVETEEVGLSLRGNVKRRAKAIITWVFDPDAHASTAATSSEASSASPQAVSAPVQFSDTDTSRRREP